MPKNLFLELETSNFGSGPVFLSPSTWWGQILPNLTFRIQKWHISGRIQVPLYQNVCNQTNYYSQFVCLFVCLFVCTRDVKSGKI